ncbi:MAG: PEGA domain-containing protein [Candidatus Cloacimonetes bacterium]|nr:PEGA domain-containing protein [Candidatus Cloacimonadota bacterium]MBT6993504.1 PEGA domain-containing protein [Candidatus Cloacimonadota bacterium]
MLASGFKPLNLVLSSYGISKLESGDVYQVEITGNKKTIIASGKGDLILNTVPENAKISIDEFPDFDRNTPYEFSNYLARPYHFHLTKDRYEPVNTVITIEKNKKNTQVIELIPKWGDLKITSEPTNAKVYIDNKFYGNTPFDLKGVIDGLNVGNYQLKLIPTSELYVPIEKQITLLNESIFYEHFVFEDIAGEIQVAVKPTPIEVFINGSLDAELSKGNAKRFPAGRYLIKIENAGKHSFSYDNIVREINLEKGDSEIIETEFNANYGYLSVTSNKPQTKFVIEDLQNNKNIYLGKKTENYKLLTGKYKITADCTDEGYIVKTQTVDLRKNEAIDFSFNENDKELLIRKEKIEREKFINYIYSLNAVGRNAYKPIAHKHLGNSGQQTNNNDYDLIYYIVTTTIGAPIITMAAPFYILIDITEGTSYLPIQNTTKEPVEFSYYPNNLSLSFSVPKIYYYLGLKNKHSSFYFKGNKFWFTEYTISKDFLIVDIVSSHFGYILHTKDHKNRIIIDAQFGLGVTLPFNLTYSDKSVIYADSLEYDDNGLGVYQGTYLSQSLLQMVNKPFEMVNKPFELSISLEKHFGDNNFASIHFGFWWFIYDSRSDFYYQDELEDWEENGGEIPQPIIGEPDNPVFNGIVPYFGIGIRF